MLQVLELLDVWEAGGDTALGEHTPQLLTWEEMTALAGAPLNGMPLGHTPPSEVVAAQQQLVAMLQQQVTSSEAASATISSSSSHLEVLFTTDQHNLLPSNNSSNRSGGSSSGSGRGVGDDCPTHAQQHSSLQEVTSVVCRPTDQLTPAAAGALPLALPPEAGAATTTSPLGSGGLLGRPEGWSGSRRQFVLQYAQQLAHQQHQAPAGSA